MIKNFKGNKKLSSNNIIQYEMPELLSQIPKPLWEDIIHDRSIPIIGAGFSKNAYLSSDLTMPSWDELASLYAQELNYDYFNAIDAISAYEHEYTRVKMIEKLNEFLHITEIKPGAPHLAFGHIPFDLVVTTNFDFLIESGYEKASRYCHILISEDELSLRPPEKAITLLKLHGDLHHTDRLIITESDYDGFLDKYPLLSTYLSNLLILRTPIFIGYSLNDPDFRQIWQVIGDRLKTLRRPAYNISVGAKESEIKRFGRRGVKVINIQSTASYSETLVQLFNEMAECWPKTGVSESIPTKEEIKMELFLPEDSKNRLCLFILSDNMMSFYQNHVFPIAKSYGFVPYTLSDVIYPTENYMAKLNSLIDRSELVFIDINIDNYDEGRLAYSIANKMKKRAVVVVEENIGIPYDIKDIHYLKRTKNIFINYKQYLNTIEKSFDTLAKEYIWSLDEEPYRLLNEGRDEAAFISAINLLETELQHYLISKNIISADITPSLQSLIETISIEKDINEIQNKQIKRWIATKNAIVHTNKPITKSIARTYTNEIMQFLLTLNSADS